MSSENSIPLTDKIFFLVNSIQKNSSEDARGQLIFLINELIKNDFASLIQLLYRIDINEKKLKQLLKEHPEADSASIITDLIIARQIQKAATKKQFDKGQKSGSEDSW